MLSVPPSSFWRRGLAAAAAFGLFGVAVTPMRAQGQGPSRPAPAAPAAPKMPAVLVTSGTHVAQPKTYKLHSRDMTLAPGRSIEIEYHMEKGAAMVYSWRASAVVPFELHGDPDVKPAGAPKDYYESHQKDDVGQDHAQGSFVAPSTGVHGWYWKNAGTVDVTIRITTAGFYDWAKESAGARVKDLQIEDAK